MLAGAYFLRRLAKTATIMVAEKAADQILLGA
jgi:hypothetical protein